MVRDATQVRSPTELTRHFEEPSGEIEIVSGRNRFVMTVHMARKAVLTAAWRIPFEKVEGCFEVRTLE
jgi:hypothetical protein